MKNTYYVGLNASYHDAALAIVDASGGVVFAEACERFLQYKRALNCEPDNVYALPVWLDRYCPDADRLVVASNWRIQRPWYERCAAAVGLLCPTGVARRGFKRLRSPLANYQIHHMMACNRHSFKRAGLNLVSVVKGWKPACEIVFRDFDHHLTHAALAGFGSGFGSAACLVVDSFGERGSSASFRLHAGRLEPIHEAHGLGSLGFLYMKLTELCSFDWMHGEEWKVMGLAAYGDVDEEILRDLRQVLIVEGLSLLHPPSAQGALARLDRRERRPDEPSEASANLARTGQQFFVEIMGQLLANLYERSGVDRLCLGGGCALNSSFTGEVARRTPFREIYVPSAPADDGCAVGAAWLAWAEEHGPWREQGSPLSAYLGSDLEPEAIVRFARYGQGLIVRRLSEEGLAEAAAELLAEGKIVGWAQGRAEFGPRALGNRSILADPRDPEMKDRINARVKFREEYRPFAPSILHEHGAEYFEDYQDTPYMERALRFHWNVMARVPAVVHRDGTGRLQSVTADRNPRFHRLLKAFHSLTGIPILLNTSFNVMGKPIVHSVEDAVAVFMTSGLDAMVLEDYVFIKPRTL